MFLRGSEEVACPDPEAGLWVRNRGGQFQKVSIPPDTLAFQLGEASQVSSSLPVRVDQGQPHGHDHTRMVTPEGQHTPRRAGLPAGESFPGKQFSPCQSGPRPASWS